MDKIRRLRSCILNIRPHLQIIPICNFETFEDGKTGMYRSLDLSGPKILKTFLDFMLNPGIATKKITML